ncbi:type II toxin-antitoxin system Phd/YefM family antitoxin [Herbiconiux sp. KACC 21604]|uniref:type II toxin-antitoxin system Phd/YefM family antitoxin n=1 Tax=unclassified Herbiconiux TaxID=2618217 RepID=UPI00149201AF|nr:type II toxin-antitoxin system Phd/YefM family antitoxin [Herbiconiux sp. SALV-R1]WPO87548.1 type II toxin-antitoxin system Phd/YefM family antitoxin [Herbiconiux sp. KACC 21604]
MATLSVADARANFSKLVESASKTHERFEVTRNGSRAAVLLSADDYDTMVETIEILSDAATVEAIRVGLAEIGAGDVVDVGDVRAAMIEAGRIPG